MAAEWFAYGDESGTHKGAPYCVVAGYVASPDQWMLLGRDWNKIVHDAGLPEFHAKDFFLRGGLFHQWSSRRAKRLLDALVSTLGQRKAIHPVGGAVDVPAFRSFSEGERRFLTNARVLRSGRFKTTGAPTRNPYQLAFVTHLYAALDRARDNVKVCFVFDRNDVEARLAEQVFNEIKVRETDPVWSKLGSITFADSRSHAGLQAADLYAYLCNSMLTQRNNMSREQKATLRRLTRGGRSSNPLDLWGRALMEKPLLTLSPAQRQAMAAGTE